MSRVRTPTCAFRNAGRELVSGGAGEPVRCGKYGLRKAQGLRCRIAGKTAEERETRWPYEKSSR